MSSKIDTNSFSVGEFDDKKRGGEDLGDVFENHYDEDGVVKGDENDEDNEDDGDDSTYEPKPSLLDLVPRK